MKILVINPGSTSTKIAVYEDEKPLLVQTIRHPMEELVKYPRIFLLNSGKAFCNRDATKGGSSSWSGAG